MDYKGARSKLPANPLEYIRHCNAQTKHRLYWFDQAGHSAAYSEDLTTMSYFEECFRDIDQFLVSHFFNLYLKIKREDLE